MDRSGSVHFGDLLRRHRRAAGLTQEALAERAGLAARGIQDLERGARSPQRGTVQRLVDALGITGRDLEEFWNAAGSPRPERPSRPIPSSIADRQSWAPSPPTSLVGRTREVADVRRLIVSSPLVTLTGPGGVGKTRLAIRVADEARETFAQGSVFIPLAPVTDAEAVLPLVAQALGIREGGGREPADALEDHLQDKRVLLVLDNFEHMLPSEVDPAEQQASCQRLLLRVAHLLQRCHGLRVLVTSRAPLRVQGEQEYQVPRLRLPPAGRLPTVAQVEQYEAVRLFAERARARRPDFALDEATAPYVVEICRRLDGLPLAIELAAARVRMLPPKAMLERLQLSFLSGGPVDGDSRHRTLRDTIAWSHDLLSPWEQALFRRLAVFSGGWALDATADVCGPSEDGGPAVLDSLTALVEQSLVESRQTDDGDVRLSVLETIHEFAQEQLAASGEAERYRRRHAEHFLALAERAEPLLRGPQQATWLNALETEHDNLRAGMAWARRAGEHKITFGFGAALWRFWHVRGHLSEGRAYLEGVLAAAPVSEERGSLAAKARVLHGAGLLAHSQDDRSRAEARHRESLALWRELGDGEGEGTSLNNLGLVAYDRGDYTEAAARFVESLSIRRRLGQDRGVAATLNNLGLVALNEGNNSEATRLFAESLSICRAYGDARGVATALSNLGRIAMDAGNDAEAEALQMESLALRRGLDDKNGCAASLGNLGIIARRRGDLHQASDLLDEALTLCRQIGNKVGIAMTLEALAGVFVELSAPHRAARLLGAASAIRRAVGTPVHPDHLAVYEQDVAAVRRALDGTRLHAEWTLGETFPLDEVIGDLAGPLPETTANSAR